MERKCKACGTSFPPLSDNHIYCSATCKPKKKSSKCCYEVDLTCTEVGTIAERVISVDLMTKGYDVFEPVSADCFCDLFASRGEERRFFQVRSAYLINGKVCFNKHHHAGITDFALYDHANRQITYIPISGIQERQ